MQGEEALPIVRELGVANLASGVVGLASIAMPSFVLPAAISAGIFYAVAGFTHVMEKKRSFNENVAMMSDLFLAAILTAVVAAGLAAQMPQL